MKCDVCGADGVQLMGAGRMDTAGRPDNSQRHILCAAHFQRWCTFILANRGNYQVNTKNGGLSRQNWERAFGDFVLEAANA